MSLLIDAIRRRDSRVQPPPLPGAAPDGPDDPSAMAMRYGPPHYGPPVEEVFAQAIKEAAAAPKPAPATDWAALARWICLGAGAAVGVGFVLWRAGILQ